MTDCLFSGWSPVGDVPPEWEDFCALGSTRNPKRLGVLPLFSHPETSALGRSNFLKRLGVLDAHSHPKLAT